MLTAAAGASHPAVAVLLGLGAAALGGVVVAMAWNVQARQIRLAEQLARRQFIVAAEAGAPDRAAEHGGNAQAAAEEAVSANGSAAPAVVIEGPETVVAGEQARYRIRPSNGWQVVSWAAGGSSLSQCPDPSRPDELLLIADQPGSLMITARVREGMTERRATKPVTAVADVTAPEPPFPLRLFLHGWGLVAVAVLIVGFAGALDALGNLSSSGFIALVVPLAALLGMAAVARGRGHAAGQPGAGSGAARLKP